MSKLIASLNRVLRFGYEGENNVTQIVFTYDESWLAYGNGEFKIRVLRNGDKEAYNATSVVDDREAMTLTMTVTDIELSKKGHGELQLVYICADSIKKSPIYRYNVNRAIDSEIVDPPQGSIIAEVEKSLAEIKDEIGSLAELTTEDKTSLVSAINEVNAKEVEVTVDSELSATSTNPLQNKIVTLSFMNALDRLERDESQISDNTMNISGLQNDVADAQTALEGKADKTYVDTAVQNAKINNVRDGAGEGAVEEGCLFDTTLRVSATGKYAHAEGSKTIASGNRSHAEGDSTHAKSENSHAEGNTTHAEGNMSHAEGSFTTASGNSSHAEGTSTKATGDYSHAEGAGTTAKGVQSHAEGVGTNATGAQSHTEGAGTTASGTQSHAEGSGTTASSDQSHAEGSGSKAEGTQSHAEGFGTTASGSCSHAEGYRTNAEGDSSHAEGNNTHAEGDASHAEGGGGTTASGISSHAEGSGTTASGDQSHAEGNSSKASGDYSHASGLYTEAQGYAQTVIGRFNIPSGNPNNQTDDDELFIIGNGTGDDTQRSNAHTTSKGGIGWYQTDVKVGGTGHTNATISLVEMNTALAGKASTDTATQSANGLMSAQDKTKLDTVYADYSSALTALGVI